MSSAIDKELALIRKQHNGVLHPEHVVDYARRHSKSELYKRFEWDVEKAAESHWLQTARQLIAVHIRVIDHGGNKKPFRMFFSPLPDAGPRSGGYVATEDKLQHPDGRIEIALQVLKRMRGHYDSYPLDELQPVMKVIDKLQKELMQRLPKAA